MSNRSILGIISVSAILILPSCGRATESQNSVVAVPVPTPTPTATVSPAATISEAIDRLDNAPGAIHLNYDSTLLGADIDRNGIRDDIDQYLASLPVGAPEKKALSQRARALNALLTADLSNSAVVKSLGEAVGRAAFCATEIAPDGSLRAYGQRVEENTFNTKTRIQAYDRFGEAANGIAFEVTGANNCEK